MITTSKVEYSADGMTMHGHIALPEGSGPRPAVLIAHEGIGLNDFQRERADSLAELGYVAMAMDFHGGQWLPEPGQMMARLRPLLADRDRMRAIGHAALDVLLEQPGVDRGRLVALGYGAGGTILLELARDGAELKALAAVNPSLFLGRPEDSAKIAGQLLFCFGSEDPLFPTELREGFERELQAAGVDWRLNIYGGAEHAFHLPPLKVDGSLCGPDDEHDTVPGISYHQAHAARAWRHVVDLFDEALELDSTVSSQ